MGNIKIRLKAGNLEGAVHGWGDWRAPEPSKRGSGASAGNDQASAALSAKVLDILTFSTAYVSDNTTEMRGTVLEYCFPLK